MRSPTPSRAARLQVQAGLVLLFAGAAALLLALAGEVGPAGWRDTWFVPASPLAWTVAASALCWGTWALGAAVRRGRQPREATR